VNESSGLSIIASGGIMNALDIAKSVRLGADCVGMAGYFLRILVDSGIDALIKEVQFIHEDLQLIMTALGKPNLQELKTCPIVIKGTTHHWLTERGIDTRTI
jgi:isopentenyl-diphosphate delta-isomerase